MRRIGTFIAGAIGLLLWAYLVVQAARACGKIPSTITSRISTCRIRPSSICLKSG